MNRLLLPAGALLALLFVFDRAMAQRERIEQLDGELRAMPARMTCLRDALAEQQAAREAEFERALEAQRAGDAAEAELVHRLQALLSDQSAQLDEQRQRLAEWELEWSDLAPSELRRELHELRFAQDGQRGEVAALNQRRDEDSRRSSRELRELSRRIESALPAVDADRQWSELVGPVAQLIGDTTVGSGVLLESRALADGGYETHLLTAWHVVRDIFGAPDNLDAPVPIKVYAPDGTWRSETAHLRAHAREIDLALLELDTRERMPYGATLATREELAAMRVLDGVTAVGCPLGNDPIPTVGELASTHHEIDGARYWMISAPTYIGNSGGGIYHTKTRSLVGIFSKIYTHGSTRSTIVPHMGLATPLTTVYEWLDTTDYAFLAPPSQANPQTAAMRR